ncbi:nuclear transport factor 2 family protein [Brevundimonas sp.]|jgi:ketosteroid isomerase-like protein|uniref:YybH family protein n=1 Tax=Brevundimonas sp. TaxID=1871086 RepID=UPI003569D69A
MSRPLLAAAAAALLLSASPVGALAQAVPDPVVDMATRAQAAASVVDAFHGALDAGQTDVALALLAEDAMVFEEGGAERSRAEYASHHLEADAAYAAVSESTMSRRMGRMSGDIAWIMSEGRTVGQAGNSATARVTVETMILRHGPDGWRIQHIHWSSQAAPSA